MSNTRPDALVGKRIALLRAERGLTQRQLTKGLNRVSYAYVSRVERDQRQPSWRALAEIAARLDTTALYLATGEPDGACPMCGRH